MYFSINWKQNQKGGHNETWKTFGASTRDCNILRYTKDIGRDKEAVQDLGYFGRRVYELALRCQGVQIQSQKQNLQESIPKVGIHDTDKIFLTSTKGVRFMSNQTNQTKPNTDENKQSASSVPTNPSPKPNWDKRISAFRRFSKTSGLVHTHKWGYLDPSNRDDRAMLDP